MHLRFAQGQFVSNILNLFDVVEKHQLVALFEIKENRRGKATNPFSSLGAQLAIDILSPAPTNGAGAWKGPRLRGAVDLAQELLVVQIPRALVLALRSRPIQASAPPSYSWTSRASYPTTPPCVYVTGLLLCRHRW